jgi:hypothetical protein
MTRRHYTTDFKAAAAELVTEQGYGNRAAAASLGVPPAPCSTGSDATAGPGPPPRRPTTPRR